MKKEQKSGIMSKVFVIGIIFAMTIGMLSASLIAPAIAEPTEGTRGTRADWYNANWEYRTVVSYTNSQPTTFTNITVRLDINSTNGFDFSHFNALGTDVRITDSDHEAPLLEYWVEYWSDVNKDATLWVKIPVLTASTNTLIYVYYGNDAATTSRSNGTACFRHFDTFTGYSARESRSADLYGQGAMFEKAYAANPVFELNETFFNETFGVMMGVSMGNISSTNHMVYGTYINDTYVAINGASDTGNGTSWTRYTNNPIINHSAVADDPDHLKATEPDLLTNITEDYCKQIVPEFAAGTEYYIAYSGLNATNWSINGASSTDMDKAWTKDPTNPILNATDGYWNTSGVKKPVIWKVGETDYKMLFSGSNDENATWNIGVATSSDLSTWNTLSGATWPVMNVSTEAWAWDNTAIFPLDIWATSAGHYTLLYSGVNATGVARIGLAYSTTLLSWTKYAGVVTLGDSGRFDETRTLYGTGHIPTGSRGLATENYRLFYTGNNTTATSLGYATLVNASSDSVSWSHNGTYMSCFALYNGKLRVDLNFTYLLSAVDGYDDASWDNTTTSIDMWMVGTAINNASLIARSTGDAYAARDHYSSQLDASNDTHDVVEAANGVDDVQNATGLVNGAVNIQHLMSLRCYGDNITATGEDMVSNLSATAYISDATLTSGSYGIETKTDNAIDFDFFRVSNAADGTVGRTFGTEDNFTPPSFQDPGGGSPSAGDVTEVPVTDLDAGVDDLFAFMDDFSTWFIILIILGLALIVLPFLGVKFPGVEKTWMIGAGVVILIIAFII